LAPDETFFTCQYLLLKMALSGMEWNSGQKVPLQQPL
jgi:hypothetical protein